MLDFDVKLNNDKSSTVLFKKDVPEISSDAFSKVFESASKSFEMNKNIFKTAQSSLNKKTDGLLSKLSNATKMTDSQTALRKEVKEKTIINSDELRDSRVNSKDISELREKCEKQFEDDFQQDEELNQDKEKSEKQENDISQIEQEAGFASQSGSLTEIIGANIAEQVNYVDLGKVSDKNNVNNVGGSQTTNALFSGNADKLAENAKELRLAGEKLLQLQAQEKEMSAYLENEIKTTSNKLITQNPIKPQNMISEYAKQAGNISVKTDLLSNLQNLASQKQSNENTTILSDVIGELEINIETGSRDINNQLNNNAQQSFNFNTSSFSDLSGHITKLSLNKSADFTKVMNDKILQEQNIANQVKEATQSNFAKGVTKVSIILNPASLGRVSVNLVSNNGVLTAQLTAQTQQAAEALNKNLDLLKQNLVDQGIKVNDITVKVQETFQSETFSDNQHLSEDRSDDLKGKASHKNSDNSKKTDTGYSENSNSNISTDEADDGDSADNTLTRKDNDLGIYNNMGRKV